MAKSKRRATYEDILRLPDHVVGEILEGELVISPRPAIRHSNAALAIGVDIGGSFRRSRGGSRGPGGWWILAEPELHFRTDVIVPDLAGWRRERVPLLPDEPFMKIAPDWVCEVVSPRTARYDRTKKMRIYARAKTQHIWLVDPIAKTLEVFRLERRRWLQLGSYTDEDNPVRVEPFEEIQLELSSWWLEEPKRQRKRPARRRTAAAPRTSSK